MAQHALEGTLNASRHSGFENPEPPTGAPTPPKTLQGEARAEWDRMVARLVLSKTLSVVDDGALSNYCQLHASAEKLQAEEDTLASMFFVRQSLSGDEPKIHPVVAQLRQYRMALRMYLVEFGLTPASRGRVRIPTQGGHDAEEPTSVLGQLQRQARTLRRVK